VSFYRTHYVGKLLKLNGQRGHDTFIFLVKAGFKKVMSSCSLLKKIVLAKLNVISVHSKACQNGYTTVTSITAAFLPAFFTSNGKRKKLTP